MGGAHSREDLELSDYEDDTSSQNHSDGEEATYEDAKEHHKNSGTPSSLDDVDAKLKALKLKYSSSQNPTLKNAVKLYLHIGGTTHKAKWVISEKLTAYSFVKTSCVDDCEEGDEEEGDLMWVLKVGLKIRVKVDNEMQMKFFGDQRRADFVAKGVWAVKFFSEEDYKSFASTFLISAFLDE